MFRKVHFASAILALMALIAITVRVGQAGAADAIVRLQQSTPGITQVGHAHISGTSIASQFVGGGAGLTSVNADLLDGLNSTAFLQSISVPLTLSGSNSSHIIRGENSSTTSGAAGLYGWTSATGSTNYGVFGLSAGSTGAGVVGSAVSSTGANNGGFFQSQSSSGTGVYGSAVSASGTTFGGRFEVSSPDGKAVYGKANAGSGMTYGGYFQNSSTAGAAVFALAPATTGFGAAGHFESSADQGYAIFATNLSNTFGVGHYGIYSTSNGNLGVGVWARSVNAAAVVGENTGGTYGLYAFGGIGATGTKSFQIDHPLDPENKYLKHYCAEGPEALNIYTGTVTTDNHGKAWVELPDYYAEINEDPRYQLTVLDDLESKDFVQVKVGSKIKRNRFLIMTSAPNIEVSWEVKARRNDLWVQKHGAPVVVEKESHERGKYQHPELYGQPEERGMNHGPWIANSEPASSPKSR